MDVIAVVGLGYVGLPLVIELGKKTRVIGFDISVDKVNKCIEGIDPSKEIQNEEMRKAVYAEYTTDPSKLSEADFIIVAVPTPVDEAHRPDLSPLIGANESAGRYMKRGAVIVYESTVYPGATEDVCIPVLERASGMKWKEDFFVGYSPERINPGDREHTLTKVVKVVAGDSQETLEKIALLYGLIVKPGVHRASSIKVAEASKVIENTQRDLNIALMNELAIIFDKIGIDTLEVLEAAGTKWNFLNFRPGLVGGHCIGVDPYYLTHKAEIIGYHPQVILAGRRINDGMGKFVAEQTVKHIIKAGGQVKHARVNVLGLTFKENCSDIRNTKVVDIVMELKTYGIDVFLHDPLADAAEAKHAYDVTLNDWSELPQADAIVLAVAHNEYVEMDQRTLLSKVIRGGCFIDIKSKYDRTKLEAEGLLVWRL
jgi:UDP-N-acetyl-D-galactosamine dehydrogenase